MPMTIEEVERLEKVSGQMDGLHKEIGRLSAKSPNDALNKFKLKFVNEVLREANAVLGAAYKPLDSFEVFEEDDLPTNSDVAFIIGQYMEELERKRADNIKRSPVGPTYYFDLKGSTREIRTAAPKKIQEKK